MKYVSKVTKKGNSSYSYTSQQEAEERAKELDDNNCSRCSDCSGYIIQAGIVDSWRCYGHLENDYLVIRCGCRKKSLSEARAYWSNKPDRKQVLAAVEYIASMATLLGWKTN